MAQTETFCFTPEGDVRCRIPISGHRSNGEPVIDEFAFDEIFQVLTKEAAYWVDDPSCRHGERYVVDEEARAIGRELYRATTRDGNQRIRWYMTPSGGFTPYLKHAAVKPGFRGVTTYYPVIRKWDYQRGFWREPEQLIAEAERAAERVVQHCLTDIPDRFLD
jgi:hypothetical protein